MRHIITGATSFLGVELTRALINQGHQVIAICRPDSCGLKHLPEGVSLVYAEMSDYASLAQRIEEADVFIHLAWAGTGHGGRDIIDIQQLNIRYNKEAMIAA